MAQQAAPGPLAEHYQPVLDAHGQPVRLGQGAYGTVYRYRNDQTGEEVAIKRVQLTNLPADRTELLRRFVPSELQNHYLLNHPHVIKLWDVFVTEDHLNLVLEVAEGGVLFEHVNNMLSANGGRMNENNARWFLQQLVLTMEYFHRRNIAHRDIKLENTLLQTPPGWPRPIIKVADFGLSKHEASLAFTRVGTKDYMGPEVLIAQRPDARCFGEGAGIGYNGEQADIWSAGVMLYAMLLGRYPFDSNMPDQLRLRVMTERPLEGTEGLSAECQELLEGMLHPNQHERMTVARIKQHPWFLRDLPHGALNMTEQLIGRPPSCRCTPQELQDVIEQALQKLTAG